MLVTAQYCMSSIVVVIVVKYIISRYSYSPTIYALIQYIMHDNSIASIIVYYCSTVPGYAKFLCVTFANLLATL